MKSNIKYKTFIQLLKYASVGCIATGLNYSIFFFLFKIYHLHYLISSSISFGISIIAGFLIHRYWTFRFYKSVGKTILRYFLVYFISMILGACILHVLVEKMVYHPEWANIYAIGFTALFNYIGLRFFVFKN